MQRILNAVDGAFNAGFGLFYRHKDEEKDLLCWDLAWFDEFIAWLKNLSQSSDKAVQDLKSTLAYRTKNVWGLLHCTFSGVPKWPL
jgi:hypothetical protein